MRKTILLLLGILTLAVQCESPQKDGSKLDDPNEILVQNLDEYFKALASLNKYNGGVLIQKNGKIILHQAYNMQDDIHNSLYVNKDSQFDIHSVSKLMAKACVVKLVTQKKLSRSDNVSKYISDFPNGEKISLQHLIDHQSGLPRRFSKPVENLIEKTPFEIVDQIKNEKLVFAPGSETLYSNLGYQILYFIISEITGKPFVQNLKDEFFTPLKMNSSGAHFYLDKSNLIGGVRNHVNEDGIITPVPNFEQSGKNQAMVYSSLDDLQSFLNMVKSEPYYSEMKDKKGNIGHSGGGEGILVHVETKNESDYDIVFFSNYDEISFGGILSDVERIMTSKEYQIPKEINRKSVQWKKDILEQYEGKYDMAEFHHAEFEIRLEEDSIAFYQNGEFGGMLKAENDSILFGEPTDEDYFILRSDGDDKPQLIFKYKGVDIVGKKK